MPARGPRSRQGFGRGKSITYGRLSPPLSAFNHTLCEQNIKTCPFVCRRRIVVDRGCGESMSDLGSEERGGRRPCEELDSRGQFHEFTWNKVCEVFLQRSTVLYCNVRKIGGVPRPATVINFAALLSGPQVRIKSLLVL